MKSLRLALFALMCAIAITGCENNKYNKVVLRDKTDTLNYLVGAAFAEEAMSRPYFSDSSYANKFDIKKEVMIRGFLDRFDKDVLEGDDAMKNFLKEFQETMNDEKMAKLRAEYDKNIDAGNKYINKIKVKDGVHKLPVEISFDGTTQTYDMYYAVIKEGTGRKPTLDNTITLDYTMYSLGENEKLVEQLTTSNDVPRVFKVSELDIDGFRAGIQQMNKGAKYRFFIPSELAYRDQMNIPIPIGSTLVIDAELHDIN